MISCRELIDFLDDYLADRQPPAVRSEFEAHLAVCPYCVEYLKMYQETIRLGQAVFNSPDEKAPDTVPEDLIRAILAAREKGG